MGLKAESDKKLRKSRTKWKVETWDEYEDRERELLKRQMRDKVPTIVGQVRITAGKAKNIRIDIPRKTRPLTDRMKTQIFDLIQSDIVGMDILDLYAGSGSFGLESLSRGAKSVVFVDAAKQAEKILEKNIIKTGFLTQASVVRDKVLEYLKKAINDGLTYDLLFIDPPYKLFNKKKSHEVKELLNLSKHLLRGILEPDSDLFKGVIIIKHPRVYDIDSVTIEKLKKLDTYAYGMNAATIYIVDEGLE